MPYHVDWQPKNMVDKMTNYTFEDIKGLLLKSIREYGFESELRLYFHDHPNEYMIIIYDDHCSFQRCGAPEEASGEYNFESLDEMYKAQQIDNIVLERDWEKVRDLECIDFDILGLWD